MTDSEDKRPSANGAPKIDVEKYTLANGLEVILSENHRLPTVAVNIWYHVGPANERPGRTGFAHLFEHMMFQGSKHLGDNQIKFLQAAGATQVNGTTGFDRTNYFETMPAEKLELALWLESDRMAFLLESLTARNLANQIDVVRNERRERENSPYSLVWEELYRQLFPVGHPYHALIIGSHADIESAGLEEMRDFCRQYYVPNNASLALVGDFAPNEAERLIEKYFGPIASGAPIPKIDIKTPAIASPKRVTVTDQVELPCVYRAWLTSPIYQPGDAEAGLLAQILSGGRASRLYQKLVYEKQVAQDVGVDYQSMMLGSVFVLTATTKPGVAIEDLEKALDDEFMAMVSDGPTLLELERARNTRQASFVFALERAGDIDGVADRLNGYNHYLGYPDYVARDWKRYETISIADVQQVAQKLSGSAGITLFGVPGPKVLYDVPKRTTAEVDAEPVSTSIDAVWRSQPPNSQSRTSGELPVPVSFELANGLKVFFLEQHHVPVVTIDLRFNGGSAANPVDLPGLAAFTASMLSRGTAQRSQLQIADDFARLGANWESHSGSMGSMVNAQVLKKNARPTYEILSDVAFHPAFRPEEIERVRQERLGELVQAQDNPAFIANKKLLSELYGPRHPYGSVEIGTEESNRKLKREDLQRFYATTYVPPNAALVIGGDLSESEAKGLAEQYFGHWSGSPICLTPPLRPQPTPRRILILDRPAALQTQLLIGQVSVERSHPDHLRLTMMNALLGGMFSSRINNNLREVHGYTYGARSSFSYRRGSSVFGISGAIRTDATAAAVLEVFNEIDRLRESLASNEELETARESLTRSFSTYFDSVGSSTGSIAELIIQGLDLRHYQHMLTEIPRVSAQDVQRVAAEHLHPQSMAVVAAGDAAKIEDELSKLNLGPVSTTTS